MKIFCAACIIAPVMISAAAVSAAQATGGAYRVALSAFDNGGAAATGSVYWHYSAIGQCEGAGTLSAGTLDVKSGVLPVPVPEPGIPLAIVVAATLGRRITSHWLKLP